VPELTPKPDSREEWLNTHAADLKRQNPGGAFPRDDEAFVEETGLRITKLAKYFLRDSYPRLGRDLEQESCAKLVAYYPRFRGDCKYTSLLFLVVRTARYTLLRTESRSPGARCKGHAAIDDESFSAEIEHALRNQVNHVDTIHATDAQRLLNQLLASLSARNATIMLMSLDGMKGPEIAERLGMPQGTIRAVLSRARTLFRRKFEEDVKQAKQAAG
jgi:RNA polymerase sigma factor (sigma-70 family)